MRFRLTGADDSESIDKRRERRNVTIFLVVVGVLGATSVVVPVVEKVINVTIVVVVAIPLGLMIVGWLVGQVVAELSLLWYYDTPAERAAALRKGREAWLARRAQAEAGAPAETDAPRLGVVRPKLGDTAPEVREPAGR